MGPLYDYGTRVGFYVSIVSLGALAGPPISGAINERTDGFVLVGVYAGQSTGVNAYASTACSWDAYRNRRGCGCHNNVRRSTFDHSATLCASIEVSLLVVVWLDVTMFTCYPCRNVVSLSNQFMTMLLYILHKCTTFPSSSILYNEHYIAKRQAMYYTADEVNTLNLLAKQTQLQPLKHIPTFCLILRTRPLTSAQRDKQKERRIPRRRKPVLQWQGHHAPELQAELEGQGRQKLDNQ